MADSVVLTTGCNEEFARSGTDGIFVVCRPCRHETLAGVLDQLLQPPGKTT